MSFAGSTLVHTLAGDHSIESLVGRDVYGFTWDGVRITVGMARVEPAGVKRLNRVLLDNGRSVLISDDQLVVARETSDHVSFAQTGLSVMPLYLGKTTLGYLTFRQQGSAWRQAPAPSDKRRNRLVARMVYEWSSRTPLESGQIVRHKDKDRMNCLPDNLCAHSSAKKGRVRGSIKAHIKAQQALGQILKTKPGGNNHKISGWQAWEEEETFDLVSDRCSNLAVSEIFAVVANVPA